MVSQFYLVVGDIHGEYLALESLLDVVSKKYDLQCLTIVVQEVTDRGLDTNACIEYLLCLKQKFQLLLLASNHDIDFVRKQFHGLKKGNSGLFDYPNLRVPIEHIEFLKSACPYIELSHFILVHAGISPGVTELAAARTDQFIRKSRADHFETDKVVIMGHRVRPRIEFSKNQVFIDTGACLLNYHHLSGVLLDDQTGKIVDIFRVANPVNESDQLYKAHLKRKKDNQHLFKRLNRKDVASLW